MELDTLLDDKPVQHREVEGHESCLFKGYFKDGITWVGGGGLKGVEGGGITWVGGGLKGVN